jgi:Protein of unknown function (DUF4238)
MATHVQQHYVPRFLLAQWHSGSDNKLTQFQWLRGEIRVDRFNARSVAKENHLYSQRLHESSPNVTVERDFLGPHIDEPAAAVHKRILSDGHEGLDDQQRFEWSRFVLSLLVRTPEMIDFMRRAGRQLMGQALDEQPDGMLHLRQHDPTTTLKRWAEVNRPHLMEDVGVRTLPAVLTSPQLNHRILEGTWSTMSLEDSNVDALISDNPVVYLGDIKEGFSFMLPISPKRAFVVCSSPSDTAKVVEMKRTGLTKSVNRRLVQRAKRYVYSTGLQHELLIRKHLRQI